MAEKNFRKISIRQFHSNMWEEVKDLPIEITRYNVPIFKVLPVTVKDLKEETPSSVEETGGSVPSFKLCMVKMCNNYAVEGSDFCIEHGK